MGGVIDEKKTYQGTESSSRTRPAPCSYPAWPCCMVKVQVCGEKGAEVSRGSTALWIGSRAARTYTHGQLDTNQAAHT